MMFFKRLKKEDSSLPVGPGARSAVATSPLGPTVSFPEFSMLNVLDWVLAEQMAGRRPTDVEVAKHFGVSIQEATAMHDKLEEAGEFD